MNCFKKGKLSSQEIIQWLKDLRKNSYIPESGFAVSAVFRAVSGGEDDYYFAGVNVENTDHRLSTHGEEGAISAMVTALGKGAEIVEGWVMGAPKDLQNSDLKASCCGKCRQQIAGFANDKVKIHSLALDGSFTTTTVGDFLPDLFSFRQYVVELVTSGSVVTEPASAKEVENKLVHQGQLSSDAIFNWLQKLESVDYATKVSQSIVLKLDNGFYVAGTKVEEAAFISINAAQNATAILAAEFGEQAIQEVWVYSKGRDGKEIPGDSFAPLPMSALQSLITMAEDDEIPVNFFIEDKTYMSVPLVKAAQITTTSRKSIYKK